MHKINLFFDKQGKPIDPETFAKLSMDEGYKHIGYDEIGDYKISTDIKMFVTK